MFDNLSERLNKTLRTLSGRSRLTEDNMRAALRDIRVALLDADVALAVVKAFINHIREQANGQEVMKSLSPGQAVVKIVNDELVRMLGEKCDSLNLQAQPPAVVLMAGLQGSGKTTTTAKLGLYLKEQQNKKVLVASTDVYRPAAIEQLKTLAEQIDISFFPSDTQQDPIKIAQAALEYAKHQFFDVLIIDTAGRWHIDDDMMTEIKAVHAAIQPIETLFVVDSMTGQEAANTAKAFNDALELTGIVLTKADGDARGGAALSIRHITGKPIKFLGIGEKTNALEPFHPDRIASRILGMGDMLSLIEEAERKIDKQKADKLAKKIKKGDTFDLEDFRDQLRQMSSMGGISSLLEKLPGMPNVPQPALNKVNDKQFVQMEAIINSMTPQERRYPDVINGSRKRRIAQGSGTQPQDFNRLIKQFTQMQKMMKKMGKKGGLQKMMRGMQNMIPSGGKFGF